MDVTVTRDFVSPVYGEVSVGRVLRNVPDKMAKALHSAGVVSLGAVPLDVPPQLSTPRKLVGAGVAPSVAPASPPAQPAASSSASPAGQALPSQTAKPSATGGNKKQQAKRGR